MKLSNDTALKIANTVSEDEFIEASFLYEGASSRAWKVTSGNTNLIVRVMRSDVDRPTTYRSELEIFRQLKSLGVPAPDFLAMYKDQNIDGVDYAWAVTGQVSGIAVEKRKLTSHVLKDLGEALFKLHSLPISKFGRLKEAGQTLVGLQETPVEGILARYCYGQLWPFDGSKISQHDGYRHFSALIGRILKNEERISEIADDESVVLVHSDIHGKHIFIEGDHLSGLIDFGASFIGIAEWEFGRLGFEFGWDATSSILEAYKAFSGRYVSYDRVYLTGIVFALYKIDRYVNENSAESKILKGLNFLEKTLCLIEGKK